MIRLGVHAVNPSESCSFYRAWGPINRLRKVMPELDIRPITTTLWNDVTQFDIVFTQRPYDKSQLQLINTARHCNVPVWIDHDDDFTCIPRDNPCWATFNDPETQVIFQKCCEQASIISATTPELAETLKRFTPNVVVIPNAFDDYLLGKCDPQEKRAKIIAWRGSPTHQNDLLQYSDEIKLLADLYPDFEWHFFGYYPFFLTDNMRHTFHKMAKIYKFFPSYKNVKPALTIVPLADNQFNRAKSNIAWLEATYAGSVTLAPDFPEWKKPGVINYSNGETFLAQASEVLKSFNGEVAAQTRLSAEFIQSRLSLSVMNTLRAALIRAIQRATS